MTAAPQSPALPIPAPYVDPKILEAERLALAEQVRYDSLVGGAR